MEIEDGSPLLKGQPICQGPSYSMNKMKTYLYKYNTRCDPSRKPREKYLERGCKVKGGIKDRDGDTYRRFEDSMGGDEDAIVSLNTN